MVLKGQARSLRRNMTDAERLLWSHLRGNQLGYKFRRQLPRGPYIADFACLERKVIVEGDGGQHLGSPADALRDAWFRARGYRVLRVWNHEVLTNTEGVLEAILLELASTSV